jgi:acyl-coenzyme A synthetase/AMP-(fatty) acid ligase
MPADSPFRLLVTGGDRLHTRPARDFPAAVINVYGPTETTVITTAGPVEPDADGLPSIGAPIDNVHLHLLDEDGTPVPDGEPGEVFIGGTGVSRGYLRRDALTRERFLPDRFCAGGRLYRTGDIACRLPDGRYAFVGRRDDQVKVRGYRIELGEVETLLAAGPGVAQAVVLPHGSRTGRHLVAYVQPAGLGFDAALARQHLAEKLPYYMVPKSFHVVADFPLTPNGKIDRATLAAEGDGR